MSVVRFRSRPARFEASDSNTTRCPPVVIVALPLSALASAPELDTLARNVFPVRSSCTKMSVTPFSSSGTMFHASDWNTTYRPSPDIVTRPSPPLVCAPLDVTLTRSLTPVVMSRRNTSYVPFVSWRTRFAPSEMNATFDPSALIAGFAPQPKPTLPEYARLTSDIVSVFRSSSYTLLSSRHSMSLAIPQPHEPNARYPPLAEQSRRKHC